VLEFLHFTSQVIRAVREPVEQRDEPVGDRDDVRGRLVVEVEELALLWGQRQAGHGTRLSITAANAETRFPLCRLSRHPTAQLP
jgi:hypothetical protein